MGYTPFRDALYRAHNSYIWEQRVDSGDRLIEYISAVPVRTGKHNQTMLSSAGSIHITHRNLLIMLHKLEVRVGNK